eukprot:UN12504
MKMGHKDKGLKIENFNDVVHKNTKGLLELFDR